MAVANVFVAFLALDNLRVFGTPLLGDVIQLETHYYYALLALLLPLAFLIYRSNRKFDLFPMDVMLALMSLGICAWLFGHSEAMLDEGWEFSAPETAVWMSLGLWVLVLEAVRRAAGLSLFVLVSVVSVYPLVADMMPAAISGMASSLSGAAAYHAMSSESLLGLPFRAFANLVIGFLVLGIA
ncbi:MAG: TRAP transporter permease, partial [Pseudomonadales bacterium]|nr:TRAP transporter permease [Pseudomonadales bacterium]